MPQKIETKAQEVGPPAMAAYESLGEEASIEALSNTEEQQPQAGG